MWIILSLLISILKNKPIRLSTSEYLNKIYMNEQKQCEDLDEIQKNIASDWADDMLKNLLRI